MSKSARRRAAVAFLPAGLFLCLFPRWTLASLVLAEAPASLETDALEGFQAQDQVAQGLMSGVFRIEPIGTLTTCVPFRRSMGTVPVPGPAEPALLRREELRLVWHARRRFEIIGVDPFQLKPIAGNDDDLAPRFGTPLDLRVPASQDPALKARIGKLSLSMERFGYSPQHRQAAAGFLNGVSNVYKEHRDPEAIRQPFEVWVLATVHGGEARFFVWRKELLRQARRLFGIAQLGAIREIFQSDLGEALSSLGAEVFYGFDEHSLMDENMGKKRGSGAVIWLRLRPNQ